MLRVGPALESPPIRSGGPRTPLFKMQLCDYLQMRAFFEAGKAWINYRPDDEYGFCRFALPAQVKGLKPENR